MKKILLLDGNSMLFRAYYGTLSRGHMVSQSGVVTNAVYGFSTMLNKALEIIEPTHMLVAFDTKDKTFRHEMYDEYKGTRPDVDPELVSQFELVREFLDAYPIARFELSGYEADDIIGTVSKKYPDAEIDILTSDRDMLQLISSNVNVVLMKKGLTNLDVVDEKKLLEDSEIRPDQVVDMKALMGDASDNIPGVPSIGEKTALKLIKKYESFENVYKNVDNIKGKMGDNLRKYRDQAHLSFKLAEINCSVPIDFDLKDLEIKRAEESLNAFYRKYDMNSLIREDVVLSKDEKKPLEIKKIENLEKGKLTSLVLKKNKKNELQALYFSQDDFSVQVSLREYKTNKDVKNFIKDTPFVVLESKDFHRLNLEENILNNKSVDDVLMLGFIVDSSLTSLDRFKDRYDFWFHEYEGDLNYHAQVQNLMKLFLNIKKQAEKDNVYSLYENIEKPLTQILAKAEYEGILVDRTVLDNVAEETKEKINSLSNQVFKYSGYEFNLNSPKQLSEVLFDVLKLPEIKKRSTAVGVLEVLKDKHPIIQPVLEYRKYQKLYSTYANGLIKYINEDGRIHTSFNQHATQTGRLSSSDPNLQNISVRDEETRQIRKAFIASKDSYLVSIDYSQIELRVLAYLANEEKMIQAFKNHEDIHERTAGEIFGLNDVDSEMRRFAKTVNFGIVYGMSPYGLSKQLDVSIKQAGEFIEKYNDVYPGIKNYMDGLVETCKTKGYVATFFNRRRYIPEIHSKNRGTAQFGARAAMNAPIQGTAADIIKLAMIRVDRFLKENAYKSKMLLQVHDELVFNVPKDEFEEVVPELVKIMESIVDWPVPLKVSVAYGENWLEDLNA